MSLSFEYAVDDELKLRMLQPHELPALYQVIERNQAGRLHHWFPNAPEFRSLEALRARYHRWTSNFADASAVAFAMVCRGQLAGMIWLPHISIDHRWTEIGYWLDHQHEGHGLATRACRALLAMAFDTLKLHRVVIRASSRNARSCAVPRRLGFTEEGVTREGWKLADGYHDGIDFSLLEDEWRQQQPVPSRAFDLQCQVDEEVSLRLVEPRHAPDIFALVDANREHIGRWMPWVRDTTDAAYTRNWAMNACRELGEGRALTVSILDRGRLVGATGLSGLNSPHRSAETGYWVAADAQGKGIATRAARALLGHAFQTLGLNRVYLTAVAENRRSRAVAERLGMRHEGTMRSYRDNGFGPEDVAIYAILADEWRAEGEKA